MFSSQGIFRLLESAAPCWAMPMGRGPWVTNLVGISPHIAIYSLYLPDSWFSSTCPSMFPYTKAALKEEARRASVHIRWCFLRGPWGVLLPDLLIFFGIIAI